jgi:O-antigen/teichoic acid export membrane protein
MQASHKVIFNTLVMYTRAFITVFISLYSTKLIIKALGVEDFGLYSLVGGIVGMLAFFNSALTSSTQRFISVNIGKGFLHEVKKVVANSIVIHVSIGLIIVLLVEVLGLYFIQNKLVIPTERLSAAIFVFHFVIASTFVTIISVPAEAILNAHENMLFLAILGIIEVVFKLGAAIFLIDIENLDKLKVYAILLFSILFLVNLIKWGYCFFKYEETKVSFRRDFNKYQIKEQTSFVGWNLFGAACSMARGNGVAVVSNMFFGPVVNAAYGVANQVKAQSSFFSTTVLRVMNPQIMKSEGADDRQRMIRLSLMACKFGYFLLAFFAIPLIFEMPFIIEFWLGKTPPYVIVFCQLMLVGAMIEQITVGLKSAMQASGEIKTYQIIVGCLILLNLPITYFLLKIGYGAEVALIVFIIIELLAGIVRVWLSKKTIGLPMNDFVNKVPLKILLPTFGAVVVSFLIVNLFDFEYRFLLTLFLSIGVFLSLSLFFGLEKIEYVFLKGLLQKGLMIVKRKKV